MNTCCTKPKTNDDTMPLFWSCARPHKLNCGFEKIRVKSNCVQHKLTQSTVNFKLLCVPL